MIDIARHPPAAANICVEIAQVSTTPRMSITTWIVVAAFAASMRSLATKDALGGPPSARMRTHASHCIQVYPDESISKSP